MFGKKNDQQPQETPAPALPPETPQYIKNLESFIRAIARDEVNRVVTEAFMRAVQEHVIGEDGK